MSDRLSIDQITSDQLDELYDDLDRYEEVQGEMNERAIDLTRRAARAEAVLARIADYLTGPNRPCCEAVTNTLHAILGKDHP